MRAALERALAFLRATVTPAPGSPSSTKVVFVGSAFVQWSAGLVMCGCACVALLRGQQVQAAYLGAMTLLLAGAGAQSTLAQNAKARADLEHALGQDPAPVPPAPPAATPPSAALPDGDGVLR